MTEQRDFQTGFWRGYHEGCQLALKLLSADDPRRRTIQGHLRMARRKLKERGIKTPPPTDRRPK